MNNRGGKRAEAFKHMRDKMRGGDIHFRSTGPEKAYWSYAPPVRDLKEGEDFEVRDE